MLTAEHAVPIGHAAMGADRWEFARKIVISRHRIIQDGGLRFVPSELSILLQVVVPCQAASARCNTRVGTSGMVRERPWALAHPFSG